MYYTQEQIDRANQADLVSFLQGQGEQLTRAGQELSLIHILPTLPPSFWASLSAGLKCMSATRKGRDTQSSLSLIHIYRTDDTPEKRTARQKEYIKTVRELQTVLSDVRTVEDAMRAYDRFFVDNGYLEKVQGWVSGIHYRATKKGQDNPVITNKLSNTMLIRSAEYFEMCIRDRMGWIG